MRAGLPRETVDLSDLSWVGIPSSMRWDRPCAHFDEPVDGDAKTGKSDN